jgi:hypothetical protein
VNRDTLTVMIIHTLDYFTGMEGCFAIGRGNCGFWSGSRKIENGKWKGEGTPASSGAPSPFPFSILYSRFSYFLRRPTPSRPRPASSNAPTGASGIGIAAAVGSLAIENWPV